MIEFSKGMENALENAEKRLIETGQDRVYLEPDLYSGFFVCLNENIPEEFKNSVLLTEKYNNTEIALIVESLTNKK